MDNNDLMLEIERLKERVNELERQQEINALFKKNVVAKLQNVVDDLKVIKGEKVTHSQAVPVHKPTAQTVSPRQVEKPTAQTVLSPGQVQKPAAQTVSPKQISKPVRIENKDFEKKFGKNIMGIIASVLIIVSLISFGGLVYKYLTDVTKMAIMYIISTALTVVGIVMMKKKEKAKLVFSALAACGTIGIYITSFIGCFVFEMYDKPVLLILVCIWLILTCIASKFSSGMFVYIFNIGLVISAFLDASGSSNFMWDVIGYFIGITALYLIHRRMDFKKDFLYFAQIPVITLIFYSFKNCNLSTQIIMAVFNIVVLFADNLLYSVDKFDENEGNFAKVWWYISTILSYSCAALFIYQTEIISLKYAFLAVIVIVMVLYHLKYNKSDSLTNTIMFFISVILGLAFYNTGVLADYIGFIVPAVILIVLGIKLKNSFYKYTGYGFMALYILSYPAKTENCICALIMLAAIVAMGILIRLNYSVIDKLILTVITLMSIIKFSADKFDLAMFAVLPIFIIILAIPYYEMDWKTKERELVSVIISRVFNLGYLLYGTVIVFAKHGEYSLFGTHCVIEIKAAAFFIYIAFLVVNMMKAVLFDERNLRFYELFTTFFMMIFYFGDYRIRGWDMGIVAVILVTMTVVLFIRYSAVEKCILASEYLILTYIVTDLLWGMIDDYLILVALAIEIFIFNLPFFRRSFVSGEKEKGTVKFGYIINLLMMLMATLVLISERALDGFAVHQISLYFLMLVTIALYTINTKDLYENAQNSDKERKGNGTGLYVYICAKFTILILTILHCFSASSYIISICGILFAIACIVAGFKFKTKPFRIYGLVLSLVSVIKIVLFDVKYTSSIMLPLGLFVAGILCFGISWGYTKLEKMNEDAD